MHVTRDFVTVRVAAALRLRLCRATGICSSWWSALPLIGKYKSIFLAVGFDHNFPTSSGDPSTLLLCVALATYYRDFSVLLPTKPLWPTCSSICVRVRSIRHANAIALRYDKLRWHKARAQRTVVFGPQSLAAPWLDKPCCRTVTDPNQQISKTLCEIRQGPNKALLTFDRPWFCGTLANPSLSS